MNDNNDSELNKALHDAIEIRRAKGSEYWEVMGKLQSALDNRESRPFPSSLYDEQAEAQAELEAAQTAVNKIVASIFGSR